MVNVCEESHAPSGENRPTETNRSKHAPLCVRDVVRLQVSNVPVRNRRTTGVQIPPTVLTMVIYAERGNLVSPPDRQVNRKAH